MRLNPQLRIGLLGSLRASLLGSAFSPASLFAAGEGGFWLDPSDFSTMYQDNLGVTPVTAVGQAVGRIEDKSGNGNHFLQATAAKRPLLQQDAQGFYYLQGDGTDDVLNSVVAVDPLGADKSQGFVGVYMDSNAAGAFVMGTSPSPGSGGAANPSNPGSWGIRMPNSPGSPSAAWPYQGTTRTAPAFPASVLTKYVLSGLMDIPAPSIVVRRNTAEVGNSTASVGTGTFLPYISGVLATGSGPFPGRVYQVVCRFGPNLTADQITQTETYVNSKTGAY